MEFLKNPPVTVNLFGGLDISWIGLVLILAGAVASAVWLWKGYSSTKRPRSRTLLIGAGILLAGLLAGCGVSALTDTTEAVETASYITLFGITVPGERVALTLNFGNGFSVYWYGVIIAVGFLLAMLYGFKRAPEFGVDRDRMIDVVLVGMIGAIVCARAYYLAFDGVPMSGIGDFFAIHDGGIAIYGGFIGALIFGGITAKIRKINALSMFDLASLGFLIGQAIGRWGNFINQEVYGRETGSSWFGMTGSIIRLEYGDQLVHPLFLYESIWCLVVFVLLHRLSKKRAFRGQVFCGYAMLYGAGRFVLEGMRDHSFILKMGIGISVSQVVSVVAVVAGAVLYGVLRHRSAAVVAYENQFEERLDDPEWLGEAYSLLDCPWDADDDEVAAAYEAKKSLFTDMETENEEQSGKVQAKLDELDRAYDYIVNARRAEAGQEASDGTDH